MCRMTGTFFFSETPCECSRVNTGGRRTRREQRELHEVQAQREFAMGVPSVSSAGPDPVRRQESPSLLSGLAATCSVAPPYFRRVSVHHICNANVVCEGCPINTVRSEHVFLGSKQRIRPSVCLSFSFFGLFRCVCSCFSNKIHVLRKNNQTFCCDLQKRCLVFTSKTPFPFYLSGNCGSFTCLPPHAFTSFLFTLRFSVSLLKCVLRMCTPFDLLFHI